MKLGTKWARGVLQLAALLNYRTLITQTKTGLSQEQRGKIVFSKNNPYSSRARRKRTPFLQVRAEKGVVTSLLGPSSLVALCSLAISHVDH